MLLNFHETHQGCSKYFFEKKKRSLLAFSAVFDVIVIQNRWSDTFGSNDNSKNFSKLVGKQKDVLERS